MTIAAAVDWLDPQDRVPSLPEALVVGVSNRFDAFAFAEVTDFELPAPVGSHTDRHDSRLLSWWALIFSGLAYAFLGFCGTTSSSCALTQCKSDVEWPAKLGAIVGPTMFLLLMAANVVSRSLANSLAGSNTDNPFRMLLAWGFGLTSQGAASTIASLAVGLGPWAGVVTGLVYFTVHRPATALSARFGMSQRMAMVLSIILQIVGAMIGLLAAGERRASYILTAALMGAFGVGGVANVIEALP
ncbi:Major facilitator superfamily (MFS) profile domain-containing protein [Plasmodiophora brassicae]|nr:hypothetical protein PBRA_009266 [Plasmodiophora brassicae]